MSNIASTSASTLTARPKIHRLPGSKAARRRKRPGVATGGIFALILIASVWAVLVNQRIPLAEKHDNILIHKSETDISASPGLFGAPVSEAMAATLTPDRSKTIVIKGKNESIVGQMVKLPAEPEQTTEIKTISNIDNHARRELLSIISKY